jgi:hypothetical protein
MASKRHLADVGHAWQASRRGADRLDRRNEYNADK